MDKRWIGFVQYEFTVKDVGLRRTMASAMQLARRRAKPGGVPGVRREDVPSPDMAKRWMRVNHVPSAARVPSDLYNQTAKGSNDYAQE